MRACASDEKKNDQKNEVNNERGESIVAVVNATTTTTHSQPLADSTQAHATTSSHMTSTHVRMTGRE